MSRSEKKVTENTYDISSIKILGEILRNTKEWLAEDNHLLMVMLQFIACLKIQKLM